MEVWGCVKKVSLWIAMLMGGLAHPFSMLVSLKCGI